MTNLLAGHGTNKELSSPQTRVTKLVSAKSRCLKSSNPCPEWLAKAAKKKKKKNMCPIHFLKQSRPHHKSLQHHAQFVVTRLVVEHTELNMLVKVGHLIISVGVKIFNCCSLKPSRKNDESPLNLPISAKLLGFP